MKNINLIATDKPSRLWTDLNGNFYLHPFPTTLFFMQNIYITNDEEIKKGDWFICGEEILKCTGSYSLTQTSYIKCHKGDCSSEICKKIILTTGQDLIKDGVQKIDDTFLEWFVKNPSCEFVKIVDDVECLPMPNIHIHKHIYKIIIPQEEPKQTLEEYEQQGMEKYAHEFKQETLEEAMSAYGYVNQDEDALWREGVEFGVKWQAERLYSEEEVKLAYSYGQLSIINKSYTRTEEWFEQFKSKQHEDSI